MFGEPLHLSSARVRIHTGAKSERQGSPPARTERRFQVINKVLGSIIALAAVVAVFWLAAVPAAGQAPAAAPTYTPPRTPDGQPDMQGIWTAVPGGTYNIQDLEFQSIYQSNRPNPSLRGKSRIVDPADGKIPYQPWAAARAKKILDNHLNPTPETLDPSARCFLQGVPRAMLNREFEIFQPPGYVIFFNLAHHAYRAIPLEGRPHLPENMKLWMGDSRGRWEGNTLVVDVANNNDQTWFDIVGDFHSDALHVVERHTLVNADTLNYEATIEDPKVYTRPWKMAVRLERMKEYGELWEEACYEGNARSLKAILDRPGK